MLIDDVQYEQRGNYIPPILVDAHTRIPTVWKQGGKYCFRLPEPEDPTGHTVCRLSEEQLDKMIDLLDALRQVR